MGFEFKFNPEGFMETLPIMGIGMAGVFIVIAVLIGISMILNKVTSKKK